MSSLALGPGNHGAQPPAPVCATVPPVDVSKDTRIILRSAKFQRIGRPGGSRPFVFLYILITLFALLTVGSTRPGHLRDLPKGGVPGVDLFSLTGQRRPLASARYERARELWLLLPRANALGGPAL